jgi:hypothetical protein
MIIPYRNEVLLTIYRCPICGGIYSAQVGDFHDTCATNHPPGSCCHFGEQQLDEKSVERVLFIIKGNEQD